MGNSESSDRGGNRGGSERSCVFKERDTFNSKTYMTDRVERQIRDYNASKSSGGNSSCKPERNSDRGDRDRNINNGSQKSCVFKEKETFNSKTYMNDRVERQIRDYNATKSNNDNNKNTPSLRQF